jgi:hypothetical protein
MEDHMSLPLSTLPHLRIGWQKVCDRYNMTAYVIQLRGPADLACYANRSDVEAAGTIIEILAPAAVRALSDSSRNAVKRVPIN